MHSPMTLSTRITKLLGIRHPIIQAGMSWASSNAELPLAVSQAGALGVIAAGPDVSGRPAGRDPDREGRAPTGRSPSTCRSIIPAPPPTSTSSIEERVPVLIASQGGPKQHLARFKDHGITWLHVIASPEHAVKAQSRRRRRA